MDRIVFSFLLIFLISCAKSIEIKDISIKLSDNLSSTYTVNFKTNLKGEAHVEYWENDEEVFSSPLFYGDSFNIRVTYLTPSCIYA